MDDDGGSRFFSKLFKGRKEENAEDEIASILEEGQDLGTIKKSEADMITNIFELDDKDAEDIMTHRKNLTAIDEETSLEDAMRLICSESFSRYPVYRENIDDIVGILHIKDAAAFYLTAENRAKSIKELNGLLQKVSFIPETSKLNTILKSMQSDKVHLQIVVDEYGQTAGVIALEDILEAIVGKIFDEHDDVEYDIVKASDGVFNVKGLTPLDEIERETGVTYAEDEENETLNGFLISRLDRIPENDEGTVVVEDGVSYRILKVEDRTIALVRMEIIKDRGAAPV